MALVSCASVIRPAVPVLANDLMGSSSATGCLENTSHSLSTPCSLSNFNHDSSGIFTAWLAVNTSEPLFDVDAGNTATYSGTAPGFVGPSFKTYKCPDCGALTFKRMR